MKLFAVTLALAAAALAQDTPSTRIPECANSCVSEATNGNKIAGCNQGDIKCVCSNSEFLDSIACCLVDVCDEAGQKAAVSFALALCSGAGVSVPSEVVCKTAGGSGNTSDGGASTDAPSATESGSGSAATTTGGGAAGSTAASSTQSSAPQSSGGAEGAAGVVAAPMAGGLLGGAIAALALL